MFVADNLLMKYLKISVTSFYIESILVTGRWFSENYDSAISPFFALLSLEIYENTVFLFRPTIIRLDTFQAKNKLQSNIIEI